MKPDKKSFWKSDLFTVICSLSDNFFGNNETLSMSDSENKSQLKYYSNQSAKHLQGLSQMA